MTALDRAILDATSRGDQFKAALRHDPDMLTAAQMAERICVSEDEINQMHDGRKILGLDLAPGDVRYPAWQAQANKPLDGLTDLLGAFGGDPWSVYRFLRQNHRELGDRTALDTLRLGLISEAAAVAEGIAAGAFSESPGEGCQRPGVE